MNKACVVGDTFSKHNMHNIFFRVASDFLIVIFSRNMNANDNGTHKHNSKTKRNDRNDE